MDRSSAIHDALVIAFVGPGTDVDGERASYVWSFIWGVWCILRRLVRTAGCF